MLLRLVGCVLGEMSIGRFSWQLEYGCGPQLSHNSNKMTLTS